MKVEEVVGQARDTITVKRVFGEPYERDGTTVIPVANVMGGAGGGEGIGPVGGTGRPGGADAASEGESFASGSGAGFGVRATPAGVYVIRDGDVRWLPALDLGRVILVGQLVAVVFLLVIRSIFRSGRS